MKNVVSTLSRHLMTQLDHLLSLGGNGNATDKKIE
jgi:hypothetical protein